MYLDSPGLSGRHAFGGGGSMKLSFPWTRGGRHPIATAWEPPVRPARSAGAQGATNPSANDDTTRRSAGKEAAWVLVGGPSLDCSQLTRRTIAASSLLSRGARVSRPHPRPQSCYRARDRPSPEPHPGMPPPVDGDTEQCLGPIPARWGGGAGVRATTSRQSS